MAIKRSLVIMVIASTAMLAAAENGRQAVRLLSIGNSFSTNVLNQLPALAMAGGRTLDYVHCSIGGGRLEQHWARVEASAIEPIDPKHLYPGKQTLRQALASRAWDVVTLQQNSGISHDSATYRPYAERLIGLIREIAPQATILMHQTWAYRSDNPRFTGPESKKAEAFAAVMATPPEMKTSADMHRMVAETYRCVAKELGLGLIPVGNAFHLVEVDPVWGFTADPAWDPTRARFPALPDQSRSLHGGWYWEKKDNGNPVLHYDGRHANMAGEYLGACVWYEVLFRTSPIGVEYRPVGVSDEQARYLQEAAHRVVQAEIHNEQLVN